MSRNSKLREEAAEILIKAVKYDQGKKYCEAIPYYKEGISKLRLVVKDAAATDAEKTALQRNLSQYEARIETLKAIIQAEKTENKHKLITIKDDAVGYNYEVLFGEYLGSGVTEITIRDPYVRQRHQINCLISLLELFKVKCNLLKSIKLVTGFQDAEQDRNLKELKVDLANHSVNFIIEYSETLHDRSIWLNTGWVFKMGRGLDMFKKHEPRNALGLYDFRFRRCYETEINIFHESTLSQS